VDNNRSTAYICNQWISSATDMPVILLPECGSDASYVHCAHDFVGGLMRIQRVKARHYRYRFYRGKYNTRRYFPIYEGCRAQLKVIAPGWMTPLHSSGSDQ